MQTVTARSSSSSAPRVPTANLHRRIGPSWNRRIGPSLRDGVSALLKPSLFFHVGSDSLSDTHPRSLSLSTENGDLFKFSAKGTTNRLLLLCESQA